MITRGLVTVFCAPLIIWEFALNNQAAGVDRRGDRLVARVDHAGEVPGRPAGRPYI